MNEKNDRPWYRRVSGLGTAAAAAAIIAGGAALMSTDTAVAGTPSTAVTSTNSAAADSSGTTGPASQGGPQHTPVGADVLAKVTAAVKANDPAVTVTSVVTDADGSYDVFGTKAGSQIKLEVSTDLKTITQDTSGPGGGHGGTPVTGAELTKVTAAVKAKDSAVTVTAVTKESDGSYDAFGTKSGQPVKYEISSDLKTISLSAGGPGVGGRPGGTQGPAGSGAPAAPPA